MLVIRDVAVNGATSLTGKLRDGTSKAGFGFATLNNPSERLRLNNLGIELDSVSPDELRKYAFHRVIVWFPEPGCYEITGQVGRERSLIYLNVVAKEG
jgi:hypothetical protein